MSTDRFLSSVLKNPRAQARNKGAVNPDGRCGVYWMQRAQRAVDNPALDAAVEAGNTLGKPVVVFLAPRAGYPGANLRAYAFLADGFADVAEGLARKNVALSFLPSSPSLPRFCAAVDPCIVFVDENPMREPQRWREKAAAELSVPLISVDADAVVPMKTFPKVEFAARTIRPKIERLRDAFLEPSTEPRAVNGWDGQPPPTEPVDAQRFLQGLSVDRSVGPVDARGGNREGMRTLMAFVQDRLHAYDEDRNHPDKRGTSELSAFLHFGHLGPRAVANAVRVAAGPGPAKAAFLEELIVRRELAMNYVLHEPRYDELAGSPAWALKEHDLERRTPRLKIYGPSQLENAETHDALWNAGQKEMVLSGRMHGYVRMYWAKKILEWSPTPEEAFRVAIWLNDKYELDGRDPNGFTGVAWAIGGRHDRPWAPRRPVFGMVRYMSLASTGKKFKLNAYLARVEALEKGGPRQRALFDG